MINPETGEIGAPFMRTPYNYDTDRESMETATDTGPNSMTQQQFKDEVDINTIVDRFQKTGEMPPPMEFPTEQDFTEAFDFQTSMNVIVQAREQFMTMPAKVRARFDNDPQKFMEFIHDNDNADEAIKLGLAIKRPPPEEKKPEAKAPEEKKKEDTK